MDIGPEISNKIRSAIKAKLVELGAYVDEELPDYIMVMVANKKTQIQMTEDLNLFLGGNTDKFTIWLHNLLTKLQSISTETSSDGSEDRKEKEKVERKKSVDRKKASEEQPVKKTAGRDSTKVKVSKPKQTSSENDALHPPRAAPAPGAAAPPVPATVTPAPAPAPVHATAATSVEPEEPEFTVRADTDEFTEEQKELEKQAESKKTVVKVDKTSSVISPALTKPVKVSAAPTSRASTAGREKYSVKTGSAVSNRPSGPVNTRLGERRPVDQSDGRCVVSSEKPPRRTTVLTSSHSSLKRKVPSSVVTPVAHRAEEEEEEYDPHNPSVGSVASVVRVTARKSSVPKALQANKTLLMKAMTDAEKSVTVAPKRSISIGKGHQEHGPTRSLYSDGLGSVSVNSNRYTLQQHGPTSYPTTTTSYPTTTSIQTGLTSRSRKTEIMRKMKYTIDREPPVDEEQVPDNRVVQVYPEDDESPSSPEVVIATGSESDMHEIEGGDVDETEEVEDLPLILEEGGPDEFSHVQEVEDVLPGHQRQLQQGQGDSEVDRTRVVKENQKNTKFIVTLDGVDPDQYEDMDVDVEDVDRAEHITGPMQHISTPKIKTFSINLRDSEDEGEAELTPLKKAKMSEKCRFWPACVNGNSCEYHHPTVPCRTFPSCKFGDKCLYIHPNCKYDARCTKTDCPFTHASKRKPAPVSPPQVIAIPQPKVIVATAPTVAPPPSHPRQITCKFYPNCHNMKCPFKHPKPCRYGVGCAKKLACPFYHPALPTKDKLTWKSNKDGTPGAEGIKAS